MAGEARCRSLHPEHGPELLNNAFDVASMLELNIAKMFQVKYGIDAMGVQGMRMF